MSAAPVLTAAGALSVPSSPYLGLVPYSEGDAAFFFGRSTEAAIVAANLRASRLTILYGPSGVGKSSLLMAGAVHLLREEAHAATDGPFAVCVYRSWLDESVRGLREAARVELQTLAVEEALPPALPTLAETFRAWTERAGTLLVVLDQFEEYFQYHPGEGDGERLTGFAAELARIINDQRLPVHVLLSIREDAWAKLDRFEGHIPSLFTNYLRVNHLDLGAAREAIEGPIAAWNRTLPSGHATYSIEPALTEVVLQAAAGGGLTLDSSSENTQLAASHGNRIEAPFLQLVLERLWSATLTEGADTLTLRRLEALGGARRIVENHLLEALSHLTPPEKDVASDCFRFLVSSTRTKIAQSATDLAQWIQRPEPQVTAVLEKLCSGEGGRILRTVATDSERAQSTSYELFHDVLAEPIMAWRGQHEQERAQRTARRRLVRVGSLAFALVAVFAAVGVWALIERAHAERSARQVQGYNRSLEAQINQLERGNGKSTGVVAALDGENRRLTAETYRLKTTSSALEAHVRGLRAKNRVLRHAIVELNAENTALAAMIKDLGEANLRLGGTLAGLQDDQVSLQQTVRSLRAEAGERTVELKTLTSQADALERKATELGMGQLTAAAGSGAPFIPPQPSTPAQATRLFAVPEHVAGSDTMQRQVEALEHQLARLLAQQARQTDAATWLRRADALLIRERGALVRESAQLKQTQAALESQNLALQRTGTRAAAEHRRLSRQAAAPEARNDILLKQIAAQRRTNAILQGRSDGDIASLGTTEQQITAVRRVDERLLTRIIPPVDKLLAAAREQSLSPVLAGLLSLVAYRLTPFNPDDPTHPEVYDALWLALDRLDAKAARYLIAPSVHQTGKLGTTQSSLIARALCEHIERGLTRAEWRRFLPTRASYTPGLSQPCS